MSRVAPFAACSVFAVLALSCLLGARPASAADVGSVNFTVGGKRLDSTWDLGAPRVNAVGDSVARTASQGALGVEITWGRSGWPVLVALDVLHSYDDGLERFPAISLGSLNIPPADVRHRASTLEIGVGFRRPWTIKGITPYVGAGGTLVRGNVINEMSDPSQGPYGAPVTSNHYTDTAFGYWAGGGIHRRIGPRFQFGVTARYSKAKLSIPETDVVGEQGQYVFIPGDDTEREAGGTHIGLVAGWSFPPRK